MKRCTVCLVEKEIDQFFKKRAQCISCYRKICADRFNANYTSLTAGGPKSHYNTLLDRAFTKDEIQRRAQIMMMYKMNETAIPKLIPGLKNVG